MMKCIERRTMGCRARAVMRVEEGSPIMLTQASRSHNHQPDDVKGETIAMLATLKERAKKEEELRISEILDQEIVSYPKAAFAVTRKNARRAMYRMRSRVEPVRAALTSEQMGEEEMQQSYGDCTTTKEPHSDDSEATMSTVWEEIVQPDGEGLETTTTVWQEILQPDDEGMATTTVWQELLQSGACFTKVQVVVTNHGFGDQLITSVSQMQNCKLLVTMNFYKFTSDLLLHTINQYILHNPGC
ncbi:uncharacterized protein LOC120352674 [Nilaparvata lugens]|uniref:uncharacterized protein LOC120352674 n=1 Tax=Nilaparvata lugens TaxID=108931 RepID=UPI00193E21D5|nr:uncharacterized protein LOC120352674 [Nilaparvata lugens]